jgi:hypothetical protein
MIILSIILFILFLGCTQKKQVLDEDVDSYGCITSAGYIWCELLQKCIRPWQENCTKETPVVVTPTCPKSCNDEDSCTRDSCNAETNYTCMHEAVIPCCGNAECEGGEDYYTCRKDYPNADGYTSATKKHIDNLNLKNLNSLFPIFS